jgi:hypothetical protein
MSENLQEFPLGSEAAEQVDELHQSTSGNENWELLR